MKINLNSFEFSNLALLLVSILFYYLMHGEIVSQSLEFDTPDLTYNLCL